MVNQMIRMGALNCFEVLTSINWHLNVVIALLRAPKCKGKIYGQWDCSNRCFKLFWGVNLVNWHLNVVIGLSEGLPPSAKENSMANKIVQKCTQHANCKELPTRIWSFFHIILWLYFRVLLIVLLTLPNWSWGSGILLVEFVLCGESLKVEAFPK
jgi:hypothetical protein